MKFISPYERYKLMIPFMEAQRKREMAAEEERRKQLLEEKKKQLPELEIVKIENDDVIEMSLNEAKRKRPHDSPAVDPNSNKRWRKKDNEPNEAMVNAIEAELKNVAELVDEMKKKSKQFKKGKPQKPSDFRQSSTKPVNFDYSNVSYDRFQGGSGPSSGTPNNKFQQKFKGGKKSKGNIDKMFNFSNFKLNKK